MKQELVNSYICETEGIRLGKNEKIDPIVKYSPNKQNKQQESPNLELHQFDSFKSPNFDHLYSQLKVQGHVLNFK